MADVGVDGIGEVDRRRPVGQHLDLAARREGVDLLRIEVDLHVGHELLRVAQLLVRLEQLPHPLEVLLVAGGADPALLVLPVRRDPLLGAAVHLRGADLHLEGDAALADHRGVQRLVAVGPGHGDEVLDPPGHRRPRLVDDPQRRVAILHRRHHQPHGDEVVDLVEFDLLPPQLQPDAVEALDAPVHGHHRDVRRGQLGLDLGLDRVDDPLGGGALGLDLGAQRLVGGRLQVHERQLLQLVLHLAHPQAVGDRGVDVERLLGDAGAAVLRHVLEGAHVVQAVGELDEDHANVVDHRQEHLAEVLRLALLAGRERDGADLGDPLDDVGDVGAEQLADAVDRGQGVFDHVVEQPRGDADHVQALVGEDVRNLKRVNEIRLAGMAYLALVLERREHVGPAEQFQVRLRAVGADLPQEVLESDHGRAGRIGV